LLGGYGTTRGKPFGRGREACKSPAISSLWAGDAQGSIDRCRRRLVVELWSPHANRHRCRDRNLGSSLEEEMCEARRMHEAAPAPPGGPGGTEESVALCGAYLWSSKESNRMPF
jgi:hypothetical protein